MLNQPRIVDCRDNTTQSIGVCQSGCNAAGGYGRKQAAVAKPSSLTRSLHPHDNFHTLHCSVQADSDGDTLDFPAMISQLFEFLITLAGSSRFQPGLSQFAPWLIDLSLGAHLPPSLPVWCMSLSSSTHCTSRLQCTLGPCNPPHNRPPSCPGISSTSPACHSIALCRI